MEKKRILFIIPWLPYPIVSGGHQALYSGIKAIADDYDVYLVYEAWDNEEYFRSERAFLNQFPAVHLLPLFQHISTIKQSWFHVFIYKFKSKIWNLLHKRKQKTNSDSIDTLIRKWENNIKPHGLSWQLYLKELFEKYEFDLIQVEMPWFLSFIFNLPKNVKKIYVHHELGFVKRDLELKNIGDNDYIRVFKNYIDIIEIGQLNLYDGIVTLSSVDDEKLLKKGVRKPVFNSFVAVEEPSEIHYEVCDGRKLVFIGPDSHQPNLVGLLWFLDNCWEKIIKTDNNYELKIIGKWNQIHIATYEKKYPQIRFLGFVDNLEEELKGSIMIVPITIGSGIRIKILEACSKGIPFVSTSVGAEGIPVENGIHCFIADDAETFSGDIIKLQDGELQKRFVENSKAMIKKHYSIDALHYNRINIYKSILSRD